MGTGTNSILASIVKGAIAGAAAVWVMDRITWYMYKNEDPIAFKKEKEAQIDGKYVAHVAALKVFDSLHVKPTEQQEYYTWKSIHYLLGIMPAALYAIYRSRLNGLDYGRGLLYGFGLFVVMDEVMAPVLGLSSGPRAYPWQAHVRGLVGHLALGATTDAVLKAMDTSVPRMLKSA